jgi:hypothetical protein
MIEAGPRAGEAVGPWGDYLWFDSRVEKREIVPRRAGCQWPIPDPKEIPSLAGARP